MKKIFTLLIALLAFCNVAFSASYNVKLYGLTATAVGGVATTSQQVIGAGSWYNNQAASKMELYLPLASLGSFTIDQIASMSFSTQKVLPLGTNVDFYWSIYTVGTNHGWYGERLTSEPMYYINYNAPYNVWSSHQTAAGTNQMTFFDSNHSPAGYSNAPTLADLQAGAIDWSSTSPFWAPGTFYDYGAATVKYISISTGSAWNNVMLSYLDNINITLNNGDVFTVDLEPGDPAPKITVQSPTAVSCYNYDVDVKVKDFSNVGAISMYLTFNPAIFEFLSGGEVTLNPKISATASANALPGKFILGWNSITGIFLSEDEVLFTLHFKLLPSAAGTSPNFVWSTDESANEIAGPGGSPIYSSFFDVFNTPAWTTPVRPVVNVNTGIGYCKIQEAIDAAATNNDPGDHDVITVAAGTYSEDIMVTKSLDIRGPNYLVDPNTGSRGAEAIIHPATSSKFGEIIKIRANDVNVDGFTIDGDNPYLTSGILGTNGADLDAAEAVTVYVDNIGNLKVSNNIIKNLTYFGVTLFGATYSAPATTGHEIVNNRIMDLGTYLDPDTDPNNNMNSWGGGVLLYNNQYAKVAYNEMYNVRMGVQTGNFSQANPGLATFQVIDHNKIQSRRRGIFHNLHYGPASPYTLSYNTLTALANANETNYWDGILLASLSVPWTCTTNTMNGAGLTIPAHGYQVWNVASTSPALISGGTVSNVTNGVFANNWEGYFGSNGGDGANATISGVTITPLATGTGIRLHDHPSSTHGNVYLTIGAGVIVNGGANGLIVEGTNAKVFSPVGNLALNGQTSKFIQLIDNAFNIDATAVTFNSKLGSAMTLSELFATEDKIDHKIDLATLGFVTVKALNAYVTIGSYVAPNTFALIQRGVDAAGSPGWTVHVDAGNYTDNQVLINKSLTVLGAGYATTTIDGGSASLTTTGLVRITATGDVTFDGFTVKKAGGPSSPGDGGDNLLNVGIYAQSGLSGNTYTISNNRILGTNNANDEQDYGFYSNGGKESLDFTSNIISQTGSNAMLIEKHEGATNLSDNTLDAGAYGIDPIFYMTYGGLDVTTLQKIHHNTIDLSTGSGTGNATGVSFASSYRNYPYTSNLGSGKYTGIQITDNTITGLIANRRGISLWNGEAGAGIAGDISNPIITGNTITGIGASTLNCRAIQLINLVSNATIENNLVSAVNQGFRGFTYAPGTGIASGTQLHQNSFTNFTELNWAGASALNATCNWYGINTVSGVAAKINGNITYDPWLVSGTNTGSPPGFYPASGTCTGAVNLYVNDIWDGTEGYTTIAGNDLTGNGTPSAPFATIGKAVSVAVAGSTIYVDAGTYPEQVQIGMSLNIIGLDRTKTFVTPPSTFPSVAWNNAHPVIYAYGNANTVNISKIAIDGNGGRTVDWFVGALYYEANGTFTDNKITGIHDAGAFSGMQMGHAYYGVHDGTMTQNLTITGNIVEDYQKGGIYLKGTGTAATITGNTVTGQNVGEVTAQNGICVMSGATATITGNIVSKNIWNKVEHPHTWTASGILLYQSGACNVSTNNLSGNEIGLSSYQHGGSTFGINTFSDNKIHLWLDVAGDVNGGNVYDKYVNNNTMPEAVFGCIQYAVDEAYDNTTSGVVLTASNNDFIENVTVWYGVTIQGGGIGITKVFPAISNPNCGGGGGGSLCAGSSNVFLVQADNVTIQKLTVDGNNPSLTSGVLSNGIDVDARNGIITNHAAGVYNNLNVNNVKVQNIYLRGLYASSGGSFNFYNNTVNNVNGESASIAMFNFGGSGAFTSNIVSDANDAIASNWSTGTTYTGNTVTNSGSGIHTDNSGSGTGTADVIENNDISNSPVNGYGIFVFAPYKNVLVQKNTITNVEVGLTCAGSYSASTTPVFTQNTVDGQMKANSIGVYSTTEIWGYTSGNQNVVFTNNFIKNNVKGFLLASEFGYTNTTRANQNSITGNTTGVKLVKDYTEVPPTGSFALDMECNWWGATSATAVATAVAAASPPVDYTPWLINGTDDQLAVPGFQPVSGSCHGSPIELTCAENVTEVSCQSQAAINTKFTAWLGTTSASGCSGTLTTDPTTPAAPAACGGYVDVTWNYASDCGNLTCTRRFTVTAAPAVQITCPPDVIVNQTQEKDPFATGYATATDCNASSTITFNDDRSKLDQCNSTGFITRTWSVTNSCGSTATCQQKITVTDVTDPVLTACPSNITKDTDPGYCSAVVTYTAPTATDFGYFQGFENPAWLSGNSDNNPSTDWNDYASAIARVPSGTDGINSKSGGAHAVINSTANIIPNTTGAFCRLGGYNGTFGLGFISSVDVFFNMSDPRLATGDYGWDLDQAVSNNTGGFLRDFVYHVAGDNTGIYVCVGNGSSDAIPGMTPAEIQAQPHASIPSGTPSGWYTMKWESRNDAGFLAVDFTIINQSGSVIWTTSITGTDAIATVGGNRYMWFNFIAADKLAIENTSLVRKLEVSSLPASGTSFAKGTTTVNCNTADACGHTKACSFTVTVEDHVAPVISACPPAKQFFGCSTLAITPLGYSETEVSVSAAQFGTEGGTATDVCGVTYYSYKDSKANICPLVVTRLWTVKDASGNATTCNQTINIIDNVDPTIVCPAPITVCGSQKVSWVNYVSDINELTCDPPPGSAGGAWVDNGPWVWQSFHAGKTGVLKSVTLGLYNIDVFPFTLHVALYSGDGVCVPYPGTQPQFNSCPMWVYDSVITNYFSGTITINVPQNAQPYLVTGNMYTLLFSGIHDYSADSPGNYDHGWYVNSTVCTGMGTNTGMPGGGTYGYKPNSGTWSSGCVTNYHIAFNTTIGQIPGLSASDNCGVKTVTSDVASGSMFGVGTTPVTYTVKDLSGNQKQCSFDVTIDPPATVEAGPDQTICSDQTATMAGFSFGGGATSAIWSALPDGGFVGNIYTPGPLAIAAGSATLTYTTNDPDGPCGPVSDFMTLTINPKATVEAGPDQTICSDATATMAGFSFGGGASSATWSAAPDGGFVGIVYTPGPLAIAAGSATMTYTTDDPSGPCGAVSDFMTLTINPKATVEAGPDQTICSDQTATMAGFSFGGGATSAIWSALPDGGFVGNIYTPGPLAIAAGSATLTYTTNDPAGPCGPVTDFITLTINPKATVEAGPPQTICSDATATMAGFSFGGGASSASWSASPDGGFVGNVYTPGPLAIAAGSATMTYTTDNPSGPCGAVSDFMTLTINPKATVEAGPDQTICSDQTATMAGFSFGGGASSATWSAAPDGGFVGNVYTPGPLAISAGSATLTYTTNDPAGPCGPVSDFITLTINPKATVEAGPPQTICSDATATMAGFSFGGGASSASWSASPDGGFVGNVYTPGPLAIAAGSATMTYTTDDPSGPCGAVSDFMTLTINPKATVEAGPDQSICKNGGKATMGGFSFGGGATSGSWSSAGDGTWSGNVYTPGTTDISNGSVVLTYTTNDPTGPCGPVSDFMTLTINTCNITGTLKYFNNSKTPLLNRTITLNSTPAVPSVTTGAGGAFTFSNVPSGTWTIDVVDPTPQTPAGGINSTDAAAANAWGATGGSIEYVKFLAGDVAGNLYGPDGFIGGTDALRIQLYFVYGTPFDAPRWVYWEQGVNILNNFNPIPKPANIDVVVGSGASVSGYQLYGLCAGDFNTSFSTPTKSASSTLMLTHDGTKIAGAGKNVELPLTLMHASTVGAVSLILNFPADLMEVTGVTMMENTGTLGWAVKGNELRIGWNTLEPLNLNAGDELLVISLKTSSTFSQGDAIRIELAADQLNELADGNITVIPDAILGVNTLEFSTNGVVDPVISSALALTSRPNPFAGNTTIVYNLPSDGIATLAVNDMLGRTVSVLVNEEEISGKHSVNLDGILLQPGVYFATLTLKNNSGTLVRTIKLVRNR